VPGRRRPAGAVRVSEAPATARVVPIASMDARLHGAWRELAEWAAEPNPFHHPDLVVPAARCLGDGGEALLAVERRGELLGCLPVRPLRRWHGVPVRGIASWRHDYCLLGTPLTRSDSLEVSARAMVGALAGARGGGGLVALEEMGGDGPVAVALVTAMAERGLSCVEWEGHERPVLRRPDSGGTFPSAGGERIDRLARARRALERTLGVAVRLVDRSEDAGARERFLALEASGWKGRAGTAMACRPRHADLFRATTVAFAAGGRLQILSLEAGVRPIAMKWNLLAGGAVFHVKTAYDEGLSRYSPGAQLEVEAMSRFLSGGELWMDSCTDPGNALLHSLWKERRRIATLLAGRGVVGRTSVAVLPSMRRLRRWRRTRAAA
jgi:hypothetical protein